MWLARPMQRTTDGRPLPFADAKPYERRRHLEQAHHALTAAGPLIAAEAWDACADELEKKMPTWHHLTVVLKNINPYRRRNPYGPTYGSDHS